MREEIQIRPCREDDVAGVAAIYAGFVERGTASFELEPPSEEEMRRRWRALRDGGYPYLVALHRDELRGYAYAGPYRTRPAYRFTVEISVYVAEPAHRRGIGERLLEALIPACIEAGKRQMVAIIGDSAHRASIRLHEKMGFRLVGTLEHVGFKHGRWLDSVIMQRSIGDGASTMPWSM